MPQYNVRIHRLGTAPSVPQEVAVDHVVSVDQLGALAPFEGSMLVFNPVAIAALVITPVAQPGPSPLTPAVVPSKVPADTFADGHKVRADAK